MWFLDEQLAKTGGKPVKMELSLRSCALLSEFLRQSFECCLPFSREIWCGHWILYLLKTIMFLTVWMTVYSPQSLGKLLGHVPQWLHWVLQQQTMHHCICQGKLESRLVTLISDSELAVPAFECHLIQAAILPSLPPQPWDISLDSIQIITRRNEKAGRNAFLALLTIGWHLSVTLSRLTVLYKLLLLLFACAGLSTSSHWLVVFGLIRKKKYAVWYCVVCYPHSVCVVSFSPFLAPSVFLFHEMEGEGWGGGDIICAE